MTTLIIGDGPAGAAAAHVCLDAVVLPADEQGGVGGGGRMETRSHDGATYDIGTTCLRDRGDERSTLVRELLGADCVAFEGRIEAFGTGDEPAHPRTTHARLTGRHGIEQVPEQLLAARHCDHRPDASVERLERTDDGWRAHTDAGTIDAQRVVMATGAERTAALLADDPLAPGLELAAQRVDHRTVDSVVLGYDHAVDREWYALAADGEPHDVRWLSRESAKPGRVPAGQEALVVRLGDDWASAHDPGAAVDRACEAAATLLDDDRLADPSWTDHERYRYAAPYNRPDPTLAEDAAAADCYLAGDWVAGTDRTFAPLETGLDAGRRAMDFARQARLQRDGPLEG
ncbi:FAD-dependent oxidoreductase [Haloglomus halophilum]|jgi:renalase|uniref:FAD-dependent oxidoreductase n=1 Tax=Haloglomus halophilum TaxID=2962672 RepID=UPI0020C982CE|nr:FAD-dependent oxidoreductase [Haloglomus halophilum]